jgi:hypothetical protein
MIPCEPLKSLSSSQTNTAKSSLDDEWKAYTPRCMCMVVNDFKMAYYELLVLVYTLLALETTCVALQAKNVRVIDPALASSTRRDGSQRIQACQLGRG